MKIQALDENGTGVEWWLISKLPKLRGSESFTGFEYSFFSSALDAITDPAQGAFQPSPHRLYSPSGAWHETTSQIFQGRNDPSSQVGFIVWNDEHPASLKKPDNGSLGHSKGILAFDLATSTAVYMMHSHPKSPDLDSDVPPTPDYGQMFFCMSLPLSEALKIADAMLTHQEPQVCYWKMPQNPTLDSNGVVDAFVRLASTHVSHDAPSCVVLDLVMANGTPFKMVCKNRLWNQDIWCEGVEPAIGCSVDVETWIRGPVAPVLSSNGAYQSFDVKQVDMGPLGYHVVYPETSDHSKQGVSVSGDWFIVSHINRQDSQIHRGGGAVCVQNRKVWEALSRADRVVSAPGDTRSITHKLLKDTHAKF